MTSTLHSLERGPDSVGVVRVDFTFIPVYVQRIKNEQATSKRVMRTTIDDVFLSVHVSMCEHITRLLSSRLDETAKICELLGVKDLYCTAFIATQNSAKDECVLVQLNTRSCRDIDMVVLQKQPMENEVFVARFVNTARLGVVRVTPFNRPKLAKMGWKYG